MTGGKATKIRSYRYKNGKRAVACVLCYSRLIGKRLHRKKRGKRKTHNVEMFESGGQRVTRGKARRCNIGKNHNDEKLE